MPLPFLVTGLAAVSGALGVNKSLEARSHQAAAQATIGDARAIYNRAERHLAATREATVRQLTQLGAVRVAVWRSELRDFSRICEQVHHVEQAGAVPSSPHLTGFTTPSLHELDVEALSAREVVAGGAAALTAGVLVGVASYGGAMLLATASTGTAIAGLSGAAATSATLAWFGGGSLAAGGTGIAGGMAALGGLVAGPVLAVGGLLLAATAEEELAAAHTHRTAALAAAAEMATAAAVVHGIAHLANEMHTLTLEMQGRLRASITRLEQIIRQRGPDYRGFRKYDRSAFHLAVELARITKPMLEAPLLDEQGAVDRQCRTRMEQARLAVLHPYTP